ncbi:translocation/assembly module TamB domain-containing protein [Phenylobacterium aquaticum]|uniref:translocation/assembly module TamB domain-containing protein n=1 Tax=Phenylobacterium aquaticum TaxID=1763816 RepID=UPI001F5C188A|nr:translocation/assembly module TamB domain-containing protein [Phenylobacterium aquaticum]MCI3133883.1 translocation/assembly module TamB domain-containing protein [Phenylobacterium aquaticum]
MTPTPEDPHKPHEHPIEEVISEVVHEVVDEAVKVAKSRAFPPIVIIIALVLTFLLGGGILTTRFGVLLPQGRLLIEASANGLKLGPVGRLKIEGLKGDIWRDFSVDRLTISDEQGVWLDARRVEVAWRFLDLFVRQLTLDRITAEKIMILRRPTLTPKEQSGGLPVSFQIAEMSGRVEMTPEFSYERGIYDVTGGLVVKRNDGGQSGHLEAVSRLHKGDHLNLSFDFIKNHPLMLKADVVEAKGGALAGAVGLPSGAPFELKAQAGGAARSGTVNIVAVSGKMKPVEVSGAWTPQGGAAQGKVLLTASTLLKPYADRFGPTAAFNITGRQSGKSKSQYDVAFKVASDNLTVSGQGLADIEHRKIGKDGVALVGDAPSLSRLIGGPETGATHAVARLSGKAADWKIAGDAVVRDAKLFDYTLDRLAGPVVFEHKSKSWSVGGKVQGSGGKGSGWVGAALGASPQADFKVDHLRDGRFLLSNLQGTGQGLKVKASGGVGLFGGLTFKGDADFANLAAARVGASGAVSASWTASQGRDAKPWTFSLDAKGAKFATGYAELDRLLGGQPRLQGKAEVGGGRIAVSEANLTGAALKAQAAGLRDADGALKFKLDWSAEGPFHAGPVEITGKAKGSGAITGMLDAPKVDLLADLDAIDVPRLPLTNAHLVLSFQRRPDGTNGVIALNAASAYGPAQARSAFSFPAEGVDLTDLSVDAGGLKASGLLSLRAKGASKADLQVAVAKGAFLTAGKIAGDVRLADAPGGPRARLNLTADGVAVPDSQVVISAGRLTADGPLAHLPYAAQASGLIAGNRWSFDGNGDLAHVEPGYQLGFNGEGRYLKWNLKTTETAQFRFGGPDRGAKLRVVASDGGRIALDARMAGDGTEIRAQVQQLGLGLIDEDFAGKFDGVLQLNGQGKRLSGSLSADLDGVRGLGTDASLGLNGSLKATLNGDDINLDGAVTNGQGLKATAAVVLPAETSAEPLRIAIDRTKPIRGRIFADGEVKPLWDLLVGGERELAGHVHIQGDLAGTLEHPRAVGQAAVDGGRFSDGATGLNLKDVTLRAAMSDNQVDITQADGSDGHGGVASGAGRISLAPEGASTFRLTLKGFRLIDNEQATASATGQAVIDRTPEGRVRLAGALTIDRADVAARTPTPSNVVAMDVTEVNRPADMTGVQLAPLKRGPGVTLDVSLKAPQKIYLKGRGLDVELSLDAHVGGTTSQPTLSGTARVIRGDYDFAGKRFEFDTRGVVYLSTQAKDIRLDLSATREDTSLTAVVKIKGTAAKPEITLTSTPTLPNDEVLSQVLFGTSASQLSPLEAAQLASALSSLAGGGGFDVIGNLKTFAGLDRLALAGGGTSGVTVSGGKYLTDNVYLELTGGGREGPSAQVEWRVRRSLSIISKIAGQGDGKLAVRWRRDY